MNEHFINLTDGTRLDIKVNFATLYYIKKSGVEKLLSKKRATDEDKMEMAAKLIHVILRSNGKNVSFEEAICLVPMDEDEIEILFEEFGKKVEDYKKKENAKKSMGKTQKTK